MAPISGSVYLAGSFTGFRDKIIEALPGVPMSDPRNNRQHAMYATNSDDLEAATRCSTVVACFPKGNQPGVMTFVELGAAYASGRRIITADENGGNKEHQRLLQFISDRYFSSIENELIPFLHRFKIKEKPVRTYAENLDQIKTVYACGTIKRGLGRMMEFASKLRPDKDIRLRSPDIIEDYKHIGEYDLIVAHFPQGSRLDRPSLFMIGAAAHMKIPLLLKADGIFPYPPISGGLQRRLVNDLGALLDYVVSVDDGHIANEAPHMYKFFERYDGAY